MFPVDWCYWLLLLFYINSNIHGLLHLPRSNWHADSFNYSRQMTDAEEGSVFLEFNGTDKWIISKYVDIQVDNSSSVDRKKRISAGKLYLTQFIFENLRWGIMLEDMLSRYWTSGKSCQNLQNEGIGAGIVLWKENEYLVFLACIRWERIERWIIRWTKNIEGKRRRRKKIW